MSASVTATDSAAGRLESGWRTVMASGDVPSVASTIGAQLGFAPTDIHGAMSPEDKLHLVDILKTSQRPVVMVGDGMNDAAAIALASECTAAPRRHSRARIFSCQRPGSHRCAS